MEKVKTSISIDKDVFEYIQRLVEEDRSNLSNFINKHFYQMMKKNQEEGNE